MTPEQRKSNGYPPVNPYTRTEPQKISTKKIYVESCAVRGTEEVKANNVLPFGQHSHKRKRKPGTFDLQNIAKNFIHYMTLCTAAKYHD